MSTELYRYIGNTEWIPNYCRKYLPDPEDAKDLSQHVIERILLQADKWRGEGGEKGFKNWVKRIIHNEFATQYRKNKKTTKVAVEEAYYLEDGTSNHYERYDNLNLLKSCLEILEKENKKNLVQIFDLKMRGYKYREISEILSMPTGTIKIQVFKARQVLSEKLGIKIQEVEEE